MRPFVLLVFPLFLGSVASGQNCPLTQERGPGEASAPSTLRGTLVFHDELRQWLGLQLEQQACGEADVQLIFSDAKAWRIAESFRGCAISATAKLFDSPTGYYSAQIAMADPELKPDPSCHPFPIRPDPTSAPIPKDVKSFRASITVDYRGKGHVAVQVWDAASKQPLEPWQAFVHYHLTGGTDVMWFGCHADFKIGDMTQAPKSPSGFTQVDENLPGTVLQNVEGVNKVEFSCKKRLESSPPKGTLRKDQPR